MDRWLPDEKPRVPRVIERVVAKVKAGTEYAQSVWTRMRHALDKALMPYPKARIAVMQAIEEEFIARNPVEVQEGSARDILHSWDIARFARERLDFEADAVQSVIMNGRIPWIVELYAAVGEVDHNRNHGRPPGILQSGKPYDCRAFHLRSVGSL